jgi:hypothetical protein
VIEGASKKNSQATNALKQEAENGGICSNVDRLSLIERKHGAADHT